MSHVRRWKSGVAVAAALVLALTPAASASHEEDATLTLRQEPTEGECASLVIELDDADNATIRFAISHSGDGSAPDTELVSGEPMGTLDPTSGAWDYELGPYTREDLQQRTTDLYVGVAWGEPGEHRIISDTFDLRCGEDNAPPSTPPSFAQPPVCTDSLTAEATSEGVHLRWDAVVANEDELDHYRVVRWDTSADLTSPGETIGETDQTEFLDAEAEAGATYRYSVHAVGETFTSCGSLEVTAVPFLGAPALVAVAMLGSVGVYALWRRRG